MLEIKVTLSADDKLFGIMGELLKAFHGFTAITPDCRVVQNETAAKNPEPPKTVEPTAEPAVEQEQKAEETPKDAEQKAEIEPQATIEEVRQALTDLRKKYGMDKVKQLLNDCGASKVSELKPEQYAAVIQVVKGAL